MDPGQTTVALGKTIDVLMGFEQKNARSDLHFRRWVLLPLRKRSGGGWMTGMEVRSHCHALDKG